jgi:hypothetical protein
MAATKGLVAVAVASAPVVAVASPPVVAVAESEAGAVAVAVVESGMAFERWG